MKRVIALLLGLVLIACTFTACFSMAPEETHTHTYSETWSSDAEGHWYDPTCDCEDAPIKKLAHADANNDGACDVCTFTNHTHTYAEGWTVDCTNHWHAADCGHTVAGTDVAAHVDESEDGKCDVCAYVIEDIHVHYYDDAWSNDAEYHWHAALCEHSVEVADKEAHILDAAGYCTICDAKINEIDKTNIEAVLKAAVARNNKVTGGKVIYRNDIYDLVDGEYVASSKIYNDVYYTLGNGHSYINYITIDEDWGNSANQQWYELLNAETGEIFGVQSTDGGLTFSEVTGAPEHLNGYNYMPSTLLAGFDTTYTLADTLLAIYTLSTADTAGNVDIEYDEETGAYAIAYDYVALNVVDFTDPDTGDKTTTYETSYFVVAAGFVCNEDGVITEAAIIVDSYQDVSFDDDYDYNERTGAITMNDNAAPDRYAYVVAQTSGERTYTTAYPKASLIPTSFDLTYNNEVVGDAITVNAGSFTHLYLANIAPATSDPSFLSADDVTMQLVNNDANSQYTFTPYFSFSGDNIYFYPQQAGTFTLTVTYKEMVKTITITVNPPIPQSIGAYGFKWESGWGDTWYEVSENNLISNVNLDPGETLDFAVRVSPALADQGFTYTIDSDLATVSEITLNNVMVFTENLETYTALQFVSDTEGTYTVTFTSTKDATVTGTLVVTVGGSDEDDNTAGATSITLKPTDTYNLMNDNDVYVYTAAAAGTYTFTVPAGYGVYSMDSYNNWGNPEVDLYDGGGSFDVELEAGEEFAFYYGGITKDEFTIEVTVPVSVQTSITLTPTDTYNLMNDNDVYVYTAAVAGTYTFTVPAGYGVYSMDSYNNWGNPEVDLYDGGGSFDVTLDAGEEFAFYYGGLTKDEFTIEVEVSTGDDSGDNGGSSDASAELVPGTNSVILTEDEMAADTAYRTFTAVTSGDHTFQAGNLFVSGVTDADGNPVTKNEDYSYTLEAGKTYTLTFSMLSMFGAQANVPCELNIAAPTGENSLIVGANTITVTDEIIAEGGIIYTFEVTDEGTYSFNGDFFVIVNDEDGNRLGTGTVYLTAGTYNVNLSTMLISTAKDYTLTIEYTAPETGDDNTGDNTGDDNTGDAVDAPGIETLSGSGTKEDPFIITGAGTYKMTSVNGYPGQYITLTATDAITFTVSADVAEVWSASFGSEYANAGETATFTLAAGETKALTIATETGTADVVILTITVA
ncbi:MAG: hypothetical protein IJW55_05915 [Clostridia bacterium]|nr:hypothetical protein [Clostridia bacterium]